MEPFFDTLRTKEQLGYVVEASCHWTLGIIGFSFTVQSSEFSVEHVQQRIESFLTQFRSTLPNMPDFDTHVQSRIHSLLEPDANLGEVAQRQWVQIVDRNYHFTSPQDKVKILQHTCLEKMVEKFDLWFGNKSRRLQVHIRVNSK